ncbi:hypothetical protein QNI19_12285 [Cytophagaceae bacterium DM2B3-1]|uniref:Uncharacterized protein n=1 Tax=Xanthocytophaga flava TaxID=3048013 RepID=A0ABT7CJ01_9BACT|nr:hypothetical protein [Xanthocytophaga flavus]MDJ1493712.1 hypothetical protein [Xanthocytophaga flavus]
MAFLSSSLIFGQVRIDCTLTEATFNIEKDFYPEVMSRFEVDSSSKVLIVLQLGRNELQIINFTDSRHVQITLYQDDSKKRTYSKVLNKEWLKAFEIDSTKSYMLRDEVKTFPNSSIIIKYKNKGKVLASLYTSHLDTYQCLTAEEQLKIKDLIRLLDVVSKICVGLN